jgi:hypothetical protein
VGQLQRHLGERGGADPGLGQPDRELGAGLVSTLIGTTFFFLLLFFAVHVLLALHATSVVTAVTWDAARLAAESGGADLGAAEAHARQLLGGLADATTFEWARSGEDLVVTVRSDNPDLLWPGAMDAVGLEEIERTVRVRVERFRAPG